MFYFVSNNSSVYVRVYVCVSLSHTHIYILYLSNFLCLLYYFSLSLLFPPLICLPLYPSLSLSFFLTLSSLCRLLSNSNPHTLAMHLSFSLSNFDFAALSVYLSIIISHSFFLSYPPPPPPTSRKCLPLSSSLTFFLYLFVSFFLTFLLSLSLSLLLYPLSLYTYFASSFQGALFVLIQTLWKSII